MSEQTSNLSPELLRAATGGNETEKQDAKKIIAAILATDLTKTLVEKLPQNANLAYNDNDRIWDWYTKLYTHIGNSLQP